MRMDLRDKYPNATSLEDAKANQRRDRLTLAAFSVFIIVALIVG